MTLFRAHPGAPLGAPEPYGRQSWPNSQEFQISAGNLTSRIVCRKPLGPEGPQTVRANPEIRPEKSFRIFLRNFRNFKKPLKIAPPEVSSSMLLLHMLQLCNKPENGPAGEKPRPQWSRGGPLGPPPRHPVFTDRFDQIWRNHAPLARIPLPRPSRKLG